MNFTLRKGFYLLVDIRFYAVIMSFDFYSVRQSKAVLFFISIFCRSLVQSKAADAPQFHQDKPNF